MIIGISAGQRDRWEWEEFYNEGIAIVGMCIRTGKRGGAYGIGRSLPIDDREFELMDRAGPRGEMQMEFVPTTSIDSTTS